MNGHFSNCTGLASLEAVPLFPLPNVVLFPNALLPLHVFEERYKAMTMDALAGRRQIAMALLSPGWEKCYYGRPAIEKVVCVGTIVSHQRLPDGKFNFCSGENYGPQSIANSAARRHRAPGSTAWRI